MNQGARWRVNTDRLLFRVAESYSFPEEIVLSTIVRTIGGRLGQYQRRPIQTVIHPVNRVVELLPWILTDIRPKLDQHRAA